MYDGGFDEFTINSGRTKNNPYMEGTKRLSFAYLMSNHPETFDKIQKDNVILFHGTRVDALPSILKYGMNSFAKLNKDGIQVTTGEESTRRGVARDFVSFTDDISTALGYAEMDSTSENEQEQSFGIVIGMSMDSLQDLRTCTIGSDLPEIGIRDNIPVEHIKMLMVPKGKEEIVKKMVGDLSIDVVNIDIEDPFYSMDRNYMKNQFEILEQGIIQQTHENAEYTKQDVECLAKGRKLSRIFGWLSKLKEKVEDRSKEDNVR